MTYRATIIDRKKQGTILVRCYEDDVLIRTIDVSDHSLRYAEDTAENWIAGIIKE